VKYEFVYKYRFKYAVKKLCLLLSLSRSGYYRWLSEGCPKQQNKDAVLLAIIRQVERENDNNYGVRRVYQHLNDLLHIQCGYSQIQRIMHANGIKAEIKSKYKPQTTKADPNDQAFPNLLEQHFDVEEFNKVWLADITYIRVNGKWTYLAAIMDLGRRKIVGWALGTSPNANLACKALRQALLKEQPDSRLIHHSDRGCQYTSKAYRSLLEKNGVIGSMSRKGVPYDNAPMESFFQTLKTEYVYKKYFQTVEQALTGLGQWIDIYYNCRRLHSALGYKSPLSYEISRIHPFIVSA
jgi:transposase InsO family protein